MALVVKGDELLAAFQARDPAERAGFGRSRIWLADLTGDASPVAAPAGSGSAVYPDLHPLGTGGVIVAWADVTDQGLRVLSARARLGGRRPR